MRVDLLLGLQWGDVDMKEGTIAVRRQLLDHGMGRPELGDLKTAKSRRSVTLPALAVAALFPERAVRTWLPNSTTLPRMSLTLPFSISSPHCLHFARPEGSNSA